MQQTDCLSSIILYLPFVDIQNFALTNKQFASACNNDYFWQLKTINDFPELKKTENLSFKLFYIREISKIKKSLLSGILINDFTWSNNKGEISLVDMNKLPLIFKIEKDLSFRLLPDIWIGKINEQMYNMYSGNNVIVYDNRQDKIEEMVKNHQTEMISNNYTKLKLASYKSMGYKTIMYSTFLADIFGGGILKLEELGIAKIIKQV